MSGDSAFTGSIPENYDSLLLPVMFTPYARDLAARVAREEAEAILEIAAGTGAVTREVASRLRPGQSLTATDLNQAMLDVAAARVANSRVTWQVADAQHLPFPDASFGTVICQFGAMFFPDRIAAYREMLRVLKPGGRLVFSVWNRLEDNPASLIVHEVAVELATGAPVPDFIGRVPFFYHDADLIRSELETAGFARIEIERLDFDQRADLLPDFVKGLCRGSPLTAALGEHPAEVRAAIEKAACERIEELAQAGPVIMSALVVSARKA